MRPDQVDGLTSVAGLGHDVDVVGGGEDHPDARPDERFVIRDEDPDHNSPAGFRERVAFGGRMTFGGRVERDNHTHGPGT
ncbi:hypothetical protein GCM10018780_10500 [Streptomyces lanatus]|nr:hypothetical protein GCM10018780_10500 [Streptomyces lanatus]